MLIKSREVSMLKTLKATALIVLMATTAHADPNPQLVASVQQRLNAFGYSADVSKFALSTVTRLHFALSSTEDPLDKRFEIKAILRNPKYK